MTQRIGCTVGEITKLCIDCPCEYSPVGCIAIEIGTMLLMNMMR